MPSAFQQADGSPTVSAAGAFFSPRSSSLRSPRSPRSLGLAPTFVTGFYLDGAPQTNALAIAGALQHAILTLAALTLLSSLSFWSRRADDGESVSKGAVRAAS